MEMIQRSKWSESMADWRWTNERESMLTKGNEDEDFKGDSGSRRGFGLGFQVF